MNAEGNKVTLVSETIPSGNLTLKGADGYNNGVRLLNDAANALYKNTIYGATARNLNVDDVNGLTEVTEEEKKNRNSNYGNEYTPNDKYYPNIFQYEKTGYVNSGYGSGLGLSEQTSWYSGNAQADTLKGKYTYYSYTISAYKTTSTIQHALATGQVNSTGSTSHTTYWLASRCVFYNYRFGFCLFCVNGGGVSDEVLYNSERSIYSPSCALRPCIEIDLTKTNIGETGSGESTDPYSIAIR